MKISGISGARNRPIALIRSNTVVARSTPVIADGLDISVCWEEGNLSAVSGSVALRFTLSNALLFALWCD